MALTPIPTRGGAHPRASLLLRLETPEQLGCARLHPQGALLLAGADNGDVLLFATSSGGLVQRLAEPSKSPTPVTCVAWAELEGVERVIAGHKSGNVRVWDVERAAVVTTLVAHRADVAALACMAPLGLLATGSADTNIKLWDLLPGGDAGRSSGSGRSSNGSGSGSGGSPHLMAREPRQVLKGHSAPLTQLRFTPDGELLISGDAAGGLRVWHVAGGAAGRLLHDLGGTHTAAITGIACHPEERLFATCSLDRTVRVWDLDGTQAGRCIGVHGPEGRREARALAFAGARPGAAGGSGAVLLAAYADGLRTFSPDPLQHHDTADLPWSKVAAIHYTDGKLIGVSVHRGDASLHCIDLTRMKPFAGAGGGAAARSAGCIQAEEAALGGGSRMRFSEKYQVATAGPTSASAAAPAAPEPTTANSAGAAAAVAAASAARAAEQPGPAALFVAQQRERAAALAAKAGGAKAEPAVEVLAATHRRAQHASFTAATPSRAAPAATAPAGGAGTAPPVRATPPGGGRAGRHRLSAQENSNSSAGPGDSDNGSPASKSELPGSKSVAAPELPAAGPPQQQHAAPSLLAECTQQGLPAAGLQGGVHLRRFIQASRALQQEVGHALQRGDARRALAIVRSHADPRVAGTVLRNRAFQGLIASSSLFSLEVCTDFVPLICLLLWPPGAAAPAGGAGAGAAYLTAHHQAALQLLEAVLARWGGYLRDVLSGVRHGKVDLELDRRQEQSRALRSALRGLAPSLERLAAASLGGGSARQMLARVAAL